MIVVLAAVTVMFATLAFVAWVVDRFNGELNNDRLEEWKKFQRAMKRGRL